MKLTAENSKGEKMKYRLARSMKECMKTMSVDNITVKQITENCGVTRQTFYRNFMDKFDLINWYFDKLLAKSFEHMGMGKTVYDALVKKFTYIQEEHVFFAAGASSSNLRCSSSSSFVGKHTPYILWRTLFLLSPFQ